MSIAWKYFDKQKAAENALKDYEDMQHILDMGRLDLEEIRSDMESPRSSRLRMTPSVHDPQSGENNWIRQIDSMNVHNERLRQAEEYMAWFLPAWRQLSADEQYILDEMYIASGGDTKSAVIRLCCNLNIERSALYRKRALALGRLALLLYGI